MKLYISVNSPYVRMVRVLLAETGRASEVEQVEVNPRDATTGFWDINPTSRVPALQLPGGAVLPESGLICAYLDQHLANGRFFAPLHTDTRRLALFGMAHAMLDRGVAARAEKVRVGGPDHQAFIDTQLAGVLRAVDAFDKAAPTDKLAEIDMVDIAVGCAMAWVQFRHAELNILDGRPGLAKWCAQMDARPSLAATRPAA
jgi:glutathione S-transferase